MEEPSRYASSLTHMNRQAVKGNSCIRGLSSEKRTADSEKWHLKTRHSNYS
jgi:hypothetical protein